MPDREKVKKGLYEAINVIQDHVPVRYIGYAVQACWDALALLKEQESVEHALEVLRSHGWDCDGKGKKPDSTQGHYFCGECFEEIETGDKYCWNCGRLVDWDAD